MMTLGTQDWSVHWAQCQVLAARVQRSAPSLWGRHQKTHSQMGKFAWGYVTELAHSWEGIWFYIARQKHMVLSTCGSCKSHVLQGTPGILATSLFFLYNKRTKNACHCTGDFLSVNPFWACLNPSEQAAGCSLVPGSHLRKNATIGHQEASWKLKIFIVNLAFLLGNNSESIFYTN